MMSNKIEALSKGFYTTESANGRGCIKIDFGSLAELHAADDELRAIFAKASAQRPKQPVAESLAQMITEWVDTGIKMGTDWRPRLASVIALRLARYPAVEQQGEPVAIIGRDWSLLWFSPAGMETHAALCERTGLEIGDKLYRRPQEQPAPVAAVLPTSDELRHLISRSARQADLTSGANYYTAAELAADALVAKIKELNP